MMLDRRAFLMTTALGGMEARRLWAQDESNIEDRLAKISGHPILMGLERLEQPVVIDKLELLHREGVYVVRVRTTKGDEGLAVANGSKMREFYPVFLRRVAPFFRKKDLRFLESLLPRFYRHGSNYKLQGIGLWAPYAATEMAFLDLLGKLTNQSIGELLGGVKRREIAVYRASGNRGNSVDEEIDHLHRLAEETGGNALKFRLGGRMSRNADSLAGRSEALIPRVREAFGDDFTLYADSNSSYDVPNAIRIGRLMEESDYGFFEEPCPFDHLWETKRVADALKIPIAGGEQEFSMRRFRWVIAHRAVDVVQPDLHYFGGYLRVIRVARMANAVGLPCTVHMSGSGLGYVDMCHLASCIENPGPHQEFKGATKIPVHCDSSSLKSEQGKVRVPSGPGYGVTIDPDFLAGAERVTR